MFYFLKKYFLIFCVSVFLFFSVVFISSSAITRINGIAVAEDLSSFIWNNVLDSQIGDDLIRGVLSSRWYFFDGGDFDGLRGSVDDGILVDIGNSAGSDFFAIKRDDISSTSVNLDFGFTSEKVFIETDPTNDAEVCVNWLGGEAGCPAGNIDGNDKIRPGVQVFLDNLKTDSISVISTSSTQTIFVRAFQ